MTIQEIIKKIKEDYKVTDTKKGYIIEETKFGKIEVRIKSDRIILIDQNQRFGMVEKWLINNFINPNVI